MKQKSILVAATFFASLFYSINVTALPSDLSGVYCAVAKTADPDATALLFEEKMLELTLTQSAMDPLSYDVSSNLLSGNGRLNGETLSIDATLDGGMTVFNADAVFTDSGNQYSGVYRIAASGITVVRGVISANKASCWMTLPSGTPSFGLPFSKSDITRSIIQMGSYYGTLPAPSGFHGGIDIGMTRPPAGLDFLHFIAPAAGVISSIKTSLIEPNNLGMSVDIQHNDTWSTKLNFELCSLSPDALEDMRRLLPVKLGQYVAKGEIIGWLAAPVATGTPHCASPHVHWALTELVSGAPNARCPASFLNTADRAVLDSVFGAIDPGLLPVCRP